MKTNFMKNKSHKSKRLACRVHPVIRTDKLNKLKKIQPKISLCSFNGFQ